MQIQEGIFFGLPAREYHAASWIGSTDVKTLYSSAPDFWWGSHMNPTREVEEDSFALQFGRALHDRILYGEDYFRKHYTPLSGGNSDGSVGANDLKEWIEAQGGKPAKLKADNEKMVAEEYQTTLVSQKVFDRLILSAQMILRNPHLAQAFSNGWPEVSIFWMDEGVPCKCRIDWLKIGSNVDLKSFRSKERIQVLDKMVLQDLFGYRYDIQMAHYTEGRLAARKLFAEGKVFVADGGVRPDDAWLEKCLNSKPQWAYCFYKGDGAPVAKSFQIPFGSPAHEMGKGARRIALTAYRDNMEKFGTDAWVVADEPFTIADEDIPRWVGA